MDSKIYCRVIGYSATLLMHISNLIYMRYTIRAANLTEDSIGNEGINVFKSMEYRYFTTWTVGLQIGYSIIGLICETLILMNKGDKDYKLPKLMRDFRETMFSSLVWPSTWVVSLFFWTLFLYDRSLIYPEFLDKIVMRISNHVIHSAIVPVVIMEVIFRPRKQPRSHSRYIMQLALHIIVYCCVFNFTYYERGVWLYPIFGILFGTIHFYLLHVYLSLLSLAAYRLQWWLNDVVHGSQELIHLKMH